MKKWAVEFPDGSMPGQYFYDTKNDLKEFAPVSLFGDSSTWGKAKQRGYKIRRVEISVVR